MAALLMTISTVPNSDSAPWVIDFTVAGSPTSPIRTADFTPLARTEAAVSSQPARLVRLLTITWQPRRDNSMAISRPIARAEPETKAVLPLRDVSLMLWVLWGRARYAEFLRAR